MFNSGKMTESCVFCDIYEGKQSSDIAYKDDEIVIFSDIRPAANHHYLVVPKVHIRDAKQLTKGDEPLIENLVRHGRRILEEKGADLSESRFGFQLGIDRYNVVPCMIIKGILLGLDFTGLPFIRYHICICMPFHQHPECLGFLS